MIFSNTEFYYTPPELISDKAIIIADVEAKHISRVMRHKVDDIINGKVLRITDFGAFIELSKGGEGLLHISKISRQRVNNVSDVLSVNDEIKVKVLKLSSDRIELASSSF